MTYSRVLSRSCLGGNYTTSRHYTGTEQEGVPFKFGPDDTDQRMRMLCGDLRRLERDAIEPGYWRRILAERAGVDEDTLVRVLTAFYDGTLPPPYPHDSDKGKKYVEGCFTPPQSPKP